MRLINTRCPICDCDGDYSEVYAGSFSEEDLNPQTFSARRLPDRRHYRIVRCNKDGLLRSDPVLEESATALLYKESNFTYNEEIENLRLTYLRALRPVLFGLPKKAKILEVGCGNGFILKSLYDAGYRNVCGIELSRDAVSRADAEIGSRIVRDRLREGLFAKDSFDLIFFFQVFDHIYDPNGFLHLCYDLLVTGGQILSFNHDADNFAVKILGKKHPIIDIEHTYLYGRKTLRQVFEKNGFHPVKISSPADYISFRHLLWLFPVSGGLKDKLLGAENKILRALLRKRIKIRLGNLCLTAVKQGS
ncbi:class I SAM-dependent methyltransferase [Candidatus Omnitrophota bacterium]